MVADGMGAHAAGELASKLAVDIVPHLYFHYRELSSPEALQRAIAEANNEIHRRGLNNPDFHGMGTTASVLVLLPDGALVGHVGDSRVYRLRENRLEQLTFDHSLQWEVRRNTRLAEDSDFARSIPKNVITRSLGPNQKVNVDLEGKYPLQEGDTFLLCTDGLTGQVSDEELAELLAYLPADQAARVLIDLANLRGGPDNITLVIVKVVDGRALAENSPAETPRRNSRSRRSAGSLVTLPIAGVCLLFALLLLIAEQTVTAAVLGLVGIAAAVAGGVFWLRGQGGRSNFPTAGVRIGNGPYAEQECKHGGQFVGTLSGILDELREVARESDWSIRWQDLEAFRRRAEKAAAGRRFPEAVREYAAAVSFMMEEFRRQQHGEDGGSVIDY